MKQDEQISSMMGWISPEWTESLTNDYWSKGEAQREKPGKEDAEVFEDDFSDLIRSTMLSNFFMSGLMLRFYEEMNQDLKEEVEAFDDDFGEEDFLKKQMEEARWRLYKQNSMINKEKKEMRAVLSVCSGREILQTQGYIFFLNVNQARKFFVLLYSGTT